MSSSDPTLASVSAARWRIAISLTIAMMAAYFGFVLLVAFGIGATIGPLVAGALMERSGPQALYLFSVGVTALLILLIRATWENCASTFGPGRTSIKG